MHHTHICFKIKLKHFQKRLFDKDVEESPYRAFETLLCETDLT